jgi:hypothetical protein
MSALPNYHTVLLPVVDEEYEQKRNLGHFLNDEAEEVL